jgi:hypothetical protein
MPDGTWMSYPEAAQRLGISREAVRRRAERGHWGRTKGNDGFTKVCVPEDAARSLSGTRAADVREDATALVSALEGHITSLKAEIETLKAELGASRTRADGMSAEHATEIERLRDGMAAEKADHAAQIARQDTQLAAVRMASDLATAELVVLAKRLATIAEGEPEPEPRRSRAARAWRWFLRN